MAKAKIDQQGTGEVITYAFEFNEMLLNDATLKVKLFESYSEEWALFILANRNNSTTNPVHIYDIVIGPIADDRVGFQLRRYIDELIDLETLTKKLTYMKGITINRTAWHGHRNRHTHFIQFGHVCKIGRRKNTLVLSKHSLCI